MEKAKKLYNRFQIDLSQEELIDLEIIRIFVRARNAVDAARRMIKACSWIIKHTNPDDTFIIIDHETQKEKWKMTISSLF